MSAQIETTTTRRFIDHTFKVSLISLVLIILAGFFSFFFSQQLVEKTVTVKPQEKVNLESITLQRRRIGALRINVTALLDTSRWVVYEIQLYDDNDQLLASAIDESWYSTGRWREGGETGTWEEKDVKGGLDLQWGDKQEQEVTIAISVLEVGPTQGITNNVDAPVPFEVEVKEGVIDARYLWLGFFGAIAMSLLSYISVRNTGKVRIQETINDSDIGQRAILGGENALVQVMVKVLADETSPSNLHVTLWIKDGMGNQIYSQQNSVTLNYRKEDGEIEDARGQFQQYLILMRRGSYGFYVEVSPDRPVDATTLIVKENVKTLSSISTTAITVNEV